MQNEMNILQINSVANIGSTGRITEGIGKAIIKNGDVSYVAYGRSAAPSDSILIKIGASLDQVMHGVKTRIFDVHGFGSKRATIEFLQKIYIIKPDIIHLHNIHGYYINIEILFDYLTQVNAPIIWTLHDCWPFTGHCTHFDYVRCDRWKCECNHCPQIRMYPKSFFVDNCRRNYINKRRLFTSVKGLTLVTPSKWLKGLAKQSFLNMADIRYIPNGIDLNIFKPSKKKDRILGKDINGKFVILGVANRWDERKGFEIFLKLARAISNDCIIVLVGVSKQQMKNLPDRVMAIRHTNNIEELVDLYSSADVFVNPTLEDNFPTVNLEALACGIPVITFDSGGSPESLDEKSGIVVKRGDIEGLLNAIDNVKKGIFKQEDCISRAAQFDQDISYAKYIELYREKLAI